MQFSNDELKMEGMKFGEMPDIQEEKENEEMPNEGKTKKKNKKNKKPEEINPLPEEEEKKFTKENDEEGDWE